MDIARPTTVTDTVAALHDRPDATLLAGGTDVMVGVNLDHARPDAVVALRRVEELTRWDADFIGAGVTYDRLEQATGDVALAELARTVGSPQIRAVGTLGGNLGTASPAGDTLPWLAAMDAVVVLASAAGERRLPWNEYLIGPKRTARRPDEVILGVALPSDRPRRQAFAKVGVRQAMVIATVNCCVALADDGAVRVALGSVGPTVLRAREAETFASGLSQPTAADLDEFARLVRAAVRPIDDHRSSAAYRRHAAGVIARRALERCLESPR